MLGLAPVRRYAQRAADPARLWVQATLFGLDPAPLADCRVLELGCGDGAHLAGLAARHPRMQVVGLDDRPEAVAEGQRLVQRAALTNLRLLQCDSRALDRLDERFDYVVCLGLFARSGERGRRELLETLRRLLAPRGLACIECDVRPAFRLHELVTDLVQRSLAERGAPVSAVAVRAELATLLDAGAGSQSLEGVRPELEAWARQSDAWLAAELVAPRQGLLFRELHALLEQHALRYVGESNNLEGSPTRFHGRAKALLESRHEQLDREQYVDFLSGRRQRRSLVARADARPASSMLPERSRELFCVSPLKRRPSGRFSSAGGQELVIEDPLVAAVVDAAASAWPEAVSHRELLQAVGKQLGAPESAIEQALLATHERDWVELRPSRTGCAKATLERPQVSTLNRAELELGRPMTNRLHAPISLGPGPAAQLVSWLDGTRDRADLTRLLVESGALPSQPRAREAVNQVLEALSSRALLEAEAGT